jgi:hypothetical protein
VGGDCVGGQVGVGQVEGDCVGGQGGHVDGGCVVGQVTDVGQVGGGCVVGQVTDVGTGVGQVGGVVVIEGQIVVGQTVSSINKYISQKYNRSLQHNMHVFSAHLQPELVLKMG